MISWIKIGEGGGGFEILWGLRVKKGKKSVRESICYRKKDVSLNVKKRKACIYRISDHLPCLQQ